MYKTKIIVSKYYEELERELNHFLLTIRKTIDIKIITNKCDDGNEIIALIIYKE